MTAPSAPHGVFARAEHGASPHRLAILDPGDDGWLLVLADRYRHLRTDHVVPANLGDSMPTILNPANLIALAKSQIPSAGRIANFDLMRADFGEVTMHYLGELDGFRYGYQGLRDRELVQSPGRSIDQIGAKLLDDTGRIVLMLGEAKVSSENRVPPKVVDTNDDALSPSHKKQLTDRQATHAKIVAAARNATDPEIQFLLTTAAYMFLEEHDALDVEVTSTLVRPKGLGSVGDFGSYMSDPSAFGGAHVNFSVVRVDADDMADVIATFRDLVMTGIEAST